MQDIWRDVAGYSGIYEVSNNGNVRNAVTKELLVPYIDNGYRKVTLCRGVLDRKCFKVARLVADAFVPNPMQAYRVVHKDNVRTHDADYNLAWSVDSYRKDHALCKPVLVLNKDNEPVDFFPSASLAAEALGYSAQLISKKCRSGEATKEGLRFSYLPRQWRTDTCETK